MSLTIGSNTYVTVDEADAYITGNFLPNDKQRGAWEAMDAGDKEICLRRACFRLERLKYRGVKFAFPQALSFPRFFGANYAMISGVLYAPEADRYPELKEVPQAVKAAQVEEAIEIAAPTKATEDREIRNGAVQSYSIGHMSESFAVATAGSVAAVLASGAAQEYIARYTGGGYELV